MDHERWPRYWFGNRKTRRCRVRRKKLWPMQQRVIFRSFHPYHLSQHRPSLLKRDSIEGNMAAATTTGNFEARSATVSRVTNETKIEVSLSLDTHPTLAPQTINVKTGIGFLDHVSSSCPSTPLTTLAALTQPLTLSFVMITDAARAGQARRNVSHPRLRWRPLD